MSKHSFRVPELLSRPTPNASVVREEYSAESQPKSVDDLPSLPDHPIDEAEIQATEVVVGGPQYGKITVKVFEDESAIDRFRFHIIDENRKEVASNTIINQIPGYVHTALLKAGWFCTDWRDLYSVTGADYLFTFAAVCYHLAELEDYASDNGSPLLATSNPMPDKVADKVQNAAMSAAYSVPMNTGSCDDQLQEEIQSRAKETEDHSLTEAVNELTTEWEAAGGDSYQGLEKETLSSRPADKMDTVTPAQAVMSGLSSKTNRWDYPNVCVNYLPEYQPGSTWPNCWSRGIVSSALFHHPYNETTTRYTVNTETFEERGEEFLQVGVSTTFFTFYEVFKRVGENEYVTASNDGLPAIFCAAVVREMGNKIEGLPVPSEPTIVELYRAISETAVKIHDKNQHDLHETAIETLDQLCSRIQANVARQEAKPEQVPQEKLPGAIGDGVRHSIDTSSGLAGELPDGVR